MGEPFHAAVVINGGGERSWSWAAVSLSMTTIGPPHLGQRQRGSVSWVDASGSVCGWNCAECCEAKWQESGAPPVGEEAEVADADEALGEQMQQEAAQELIQRYGHQFLFVVVSRVAPTKSDLVVGKRDQAMVGDGHAMGVAAQILEHILGAAKGWFGVDDPVFRNSGLSQEAKILGCASRARSPERWSWPC